jgi:hypothetical protein
LHNKPTNTPIASGEAIGVFVATAIKTARRGKRANCHFYSRAQIKNVNTPAAQRAAEVFRARRGTGCARCVAISFILTHRISRNIELRNIIHNLMHRRISGAMECFRQCRKLTIGKENQLNRKPRCIAANILFACSAICAGSTGVGFTEQTLTGVCHGEIQSRGLVRLVPR